MASFRDLVTGGKNEHASREKGSKSLKKETPLVAEIFTGTPAEGANSEVSPGTISFYMDGAQLKFSIYVKSPEVKYFGVVADILKPFESVNSALLMGDVSRKRHSEQGNGKTDPEKEALLY